VQQGAEVGDGKPILVVVIVVDANI